MDARAVKKICDFEERGSFPHLTSKQRAQLFEEILVAVGAGEIPEEVLGNRVVDNLFEMGDGSAVVREFLRLYDQSIELQQIVAKFDRYVDIQYMSVFTAI